ncbi:MAG: replication-associated recombination protein A [bacterium]
MSLFDEFENKNKQIPLADILRPKTLEEYLGQNDITNENSSLINLLKSGRLFSLILWGPPGCGKTTLAKIIAEESNSILKELSAVNSGIKDIREIVENAKRELQYTGRKTLVFIDEIHRYTKTQQDALLPQLENGTLYLLGATTENPSFQVIPALLSRTHVLMLKSIDRENILTIVRKGFKYLIEKYGKITIQPEIGEFIVNYANGDARTALNMVESGYFCAKGGGLNKLTVDVLENLMQKRYSGLSDQDYYDLISAFQKSLRGSSADAAVYWLARMLTLGQDPRYIARRLIVTASEDIGNADPMALNIAINAYKACEILGMPEVRIVLSQAAIYLANAKKSNMSITAIDSALHDIQKNGKIYPVPNHLKDTHYKDSNRYGFGEGYIYTHENPEIKQNFMPEEIKDKKYT